MNYNRTDNFAHVGTILGSSPSSSITNLSTTAGNTNTLTFGSGINALGTIRNSAVGSLALNAAASSTNNLAGSLVNSSGTLQINGGWWSVTNNLSTAGNNFVLNGATIIASGGMASYGATNLNINSGTLFVSGGARFSSVLSNANFALTGGSFVVSNTSFGVRLGNSSGNNAAQAGYVSFNGTQTGGSFVIASNTTDNAFSLGGYGPIASAQNASYTLSGGTLTIPSGAGVGNGIWIGADSNALAATTFTLTGSGKIFAANVKGAQSAASGAKQIFNFSGGTLTALAIDMSNLQSTNAQGTYGTLYNNGGTLAPGDLGTPGKTTITGNLTNSSGALAIDLGGTTAATTLQSGGTNYDFISVSGATLLDGALNVSLINSFTPTPTDSFTILTSSNGVSGAFTNLLGGNRVAINGAPNFSFQVLTTASSVILTNYLQNAPLVGVTPANTNFIYGNSVMLTANATGISPLTYQWYDINTNPISGATNANITFTSPSVSASGNYTVIVTNLYGSASAMTTVTVNPANAALALSSSANPSGSLGNISFGANLPADATGGVVFLSNGTPFSTNSVFVGSSSSAFISSLLRGTNTITAMYSGDANYVGTTNSLAQVVTNHPPVVNAVTFTRSAAVNLFKVPVSDLLTHATDTDGDTLALASVSTTTNGAIILIAGGYVMYYNTNVVADQFGYTVNDAYGGTNSAIVTININSAPLFGQSQIASIGSGSARLNFAGIAGYSYSVGRSTNLLNWSVIWTTNAPSNGLFEFIDGSAPATSAYYRLQFNNP